MKSIKLKWLAFMVTLCVALGTVFSAAATTFRSAKADNADITVSVQEIEVPAGQTSTFTAYADAKQEFSSYEIHFGIPSFMQVLEIESEINVYNGVFEYYSDYVTFSSAQPQSGHIALFTVTFTTDKSANGETGDLHFYGSIFTDVYGNKLQVAEQGTNIVVMGEYVRQKGDFDGDGNVDIKDVMYMQRYIVGNYNRAVSDADFYAGDINGDKEINIVDCQLVQSYIIGIIGSLDDYGGGEEPHGGNDICGTYEYQGEDGNLVLTLGDDKSYSIDGFGDVAYGSYKRVEMNDRIMVYLVSDFNLIIVSVDVDNRTFFPFHSMDFSKQEITVTGFAGTYNVQGAPEETITIAENGAFIRDCYEDGNFMQYNGMIDIKEVKDGMAFGLAYVFGIDESSAAMAMSFKLDMQNSVIYVEQSQYNDTYHIRFYVNDEMVADYSVAEGTLYQDVYNQFMNDKAEMLEKKYGGAIDFNDYSTSTGINIFADGRVTCNDEIYFFAKEEQEEWFEQTAIYDINFNFGHEPRLYFYSTRQDVLDLFVGEKVSVYKIYNSKQGGYKNEYVKDVTITEDMVGDTSKVDFTPSGSQTFELTFTIDDRTATVYVRIVPDMTGAKLLRTGVAENRYYVNGEPRTSYSVLQFYDNGFIASYGISEEGVVNSDPNGYTAYAIETYNGTTLYVVNNGLYWTFSGRTVTLGRTTYQILEGFKHADGTETTDYTLTIQGMGTAVLKVFNEEFAELWSSSYYTEGLEYQGTVKVFIDDGKLTFQGTTYAIGENNILSIALPDGDPIFSTVIEGADVLFYEGGNAYVLFGGEVMMTMSWESDDENLSFIRCNIMGESVTFYKWAIDGQYHSDDEEPDWTTAAYRYDLVYNKEGESKNCTLYIFSNGRSYLFDGVTVQHASTGYQDNIFDIDNSDTRENEHYYYNENGEMYDAVRYHIELSEEQYRTVNVRENHFGYVYAVPAKGIIVGYWTVEDIESNIYGTFAFVEEGGNYVVSLDGSWVFTATPVAKISAMRDNKLVLVDFRNSERFFASHSGGNGGEVIGEGAYKLSVYNVFNGEIMGGANYMSVESFDEFAAIIDKALNERPAEGAPAFIGYYYDVNGKEPVNEMTFRSGDVYLFFEMKD